jgi:hypothetical protein
VSSTHQEAQSLRSALPETTTGFVVIFLKEKKETPGEWYGDGEISKLYAGVQG